MLDSNLLKAKNMKFIARVVTWIVNIDVNFSKKKYKNNYFSNP